MSWAMPAAFKKPVIYHTRPRFESPASLYDLIVIGIKIHTIWQCSQVRDFCVSEVTRSCLHIYTPLSRLAGRSEYLGGPAHIERLVLLKPRRDCGWPSHTGIGIL